MKNLITLFIVLITLSSCDTENSHKKFMLNNVSSFEKFSKNSFIIENLDGYYTEKTISIEGDSSFVIICWGNRNSLLWYFKKDKMITVDIPYNRYKRKDVSLDVKIIEAFNKR